MAGHKRALAMAAIAGVAGTAMAIQGGCTFPELKFAPDAGAREPAVDAAVSADASLIDPDATAGDDAGSADAGRAGDALSLPDGACDFNGTWGSEITIDVSWQPQGINEIALAAGTGQIKQWIKAVRTQTGTAISDETDVCGIVLPDFAGSVLNETYGVRFPNSLFDDGYLQPFTANSALSGLTPGAMFSTTTTAVLLGISLPRPTVDPWPGVVTASVDMDQDGKPGVTANVAEGLGYSDIPAEFPPLFQQLARASSVYLAIRQITVVTATVSDCDDMTGTVSIPPIAAADGGTKPGIDSHVLGCALADGGGDCTPTEAAFLDNTQPVFTPTGITAFKSIRMKLTASCADVRAALSM
jgi:hypothetical protein